jgi:hypothetical protein
MIVQTSNFLQLKSSVRHAVPVDAKGIGVFSNISIAKKEIGSNIKG